MASFNKKIRGLNADISEFSSKLTELNGFQSERAIAPKTTSTSTVTKKGADLEEQEASKRLVQNAFKEDGTKRDTDKQIQALQAQLVRAKKEHVAQINRLQGELDRCKSEKVALSKSLESSERIRQQQKTLISLLQQGTHSGLVENVPEDNSLTPSIRAENRMWLNPSKESASIVSGLSEAGSEGSALNKRRKTKGRKPTAAGAGGGGVAFRQGARSTTSGAPFPRGSAHLPARPPLRRTRALAPRTRRVPITGSHSHVDGAELTATEPASPAQRQRDYSAQLAYSRQKAKVAVLTASPARKSTAAVSSTPSRVPLARRTRLGADTPSPARRGPKARAATAPGTPLSVKRCTFGSR